MSPLPTQMVDRWEDRAEPGPGEGAVYWHILFEDKPQVRAMAKEAQQRLAGFGGFHMTPERWLHMTTLLVGSTNDITPDEMDAMLADASRLLAGITPITVTLGRVLYHPEAVMVGVRPENALQPVRDAICEATDTALGGRLRARRSAPWTPHVTLCYSTSQQPAAPIIKALGSELPSCEVTIGGVNLVVQHGAERLWDWDRIGTAHLSG